MAIITNERIHQILDAQTSFTDLFIIKALEALLESQVGAGAVDDILDSMVPEVASPQTVLFGHKLGDYSGLDRTTIKAKFTKPDGSALTDGDVDDIFAAMGVTSGTSAPLGGAPTAPAAAPKEEKEAEAKKEEAKPAESEKEADKKASAKKSEEDKSKKGDSK